MSELDYHVDIAKKYDQGLMGWMPYPGGMMAAAQGDETYVDAESLLKKWRNEPRVDTFAYRHVQSVYQTLGKKWETRYQRRGTCVGQAATEGALFLMAQRVYHGLDEWQGEPAVCGAYAGGRVNIAKQPGRWDGSNGNWSVKFFQQFGIVMRKHVGLSDDGADAEQKDEQLAVQWAASRQGVPEDILAKANPFRVKFWTYIEGEPEDVGLFVQRGFYAIHGSSYWCDGRLDRENFGVCTSHRGGHEQGWMGVRWTPNGELKGLLDRNSWSDSYYKSAPRYPDDQPGGTVWETRDAVKSRIKRGEVIVFAGPDGFDRPALDYHIMTKK